MSRCRLLTLLICLATARHAGAQQAPAGHEQPVIPLAFNVTNSVITFFWPVQKAPTELQVRETGSEEWKVVPEEAYHTNKTFVTARLPVSKTQVFYRLKRAPFAHRPVTPAVPPAIPVPVPMASTNLPPHAKTSPP